jgi:hypothetical protein
VNQGFVNAGNWISNASGGNVFQNWANDLQTQYNQAGIQRTWGLITGSVAGLLDGILIIVAYLLYPIVIVIFGFFYIFYGSILYIFGPIVIALMPLKEKPAPTLEEIRKRLSYSSSMCLQFHFPVLCSHLLRRREAHQKARIAQLRRTLECLQTEIPALSLRMVGTRTGISPNHLKTLCPEQCVALASRYLLWRHETAVLRRAQLMEEVQKIVHELHRQGKCPTVGRVSALLQPNSLREWKTMTDAVKMARNRIGPQIALSGVTTPSVKIVR